MGVSIFIILSTVFSSTKATFVAQLTAFICLIFHFVAAIFFFDAIHQIRAARKITESFKKMRESKDTLVEEKIKGESDNNHLPEAKESNLLHSKLDFKENEILIKEGAEKVVNSQTKQNGNKRVKIS